MNEFINQTIDLTRFNDEQIKQMIADGYALLDKRKREHQKRIKEQIKQLAQDAGVKVAFREKIGRPRKSKSE